MRLFIRYLTVALLFIGAWLSAAGAKPLRVQNFEGDRALLRGCFSFSAEKGYSPAACVIPVPLVTEVRFNFPYTPWDIGVTVSHIEAPLKAINLVSNKTLFLGVCSHYNLRQGRKVNPFFGLATGVAGWEFDFHKSKCGFAVEPRVGVEFVYHIRLSLVCQISRRYYNAAGLTLSFVIGGRPKKEQK